MQTANIMSSSFKIRTIQGGIQKDENLQTSRAGGHEKYPLERK